ncbi:hypothetical protein RSOLAG22IIIB_07346 [Rhizoctonia solani]|uniref:Uncharacterized protein n=1 Tax=Rhizoctonia solani TaxID=456999 RepID=A0A0K6FMT4_9AGAM|nr:hypothetical protein RSOLAG22IIIB_07346 [Rhizoctonia solani]
MARYTPTVQQAPPISEPSNPSTSSLRRSLLEGSVALAGYNSHSTRGNTLNKSLHGHGLVGSRIHLYHPPNQMPLDG